MTFSEVSPEGQEGAAAGGLFGIQLTGKLIGILIAVVGVGAGVAMFMYLLQPEWAKKDDLTSQISAKEGENAAIEASLKKIEEARANLETVKQTKAEVQALFGDSTSLDTLMFDISSQIRKAGGELMELKPGKEPLGDGLFPPPKDPKQAPVAGPFKPLSLKVTMDATYAQTQSIIRNIERLEAMILLSNFSTDIDPETLNLVVTDQGKPLKITEPNLKTSFDMLVIVPSSPQEMTPPTAAPGAPGAPGVPNPGKK